jgi:hypothetical protein
MSKSRDISVGIDASYVVDGRSSIPGRGKFFLFSIASRWVLRPTQPPIQRVEGCISPCVKRPVQEADQSLHVVWRSRMIELYLHSPWVFIAWCLIKHRIKFTSFFKHLPVCYEHRMIVEWTAITSLNGINILIFLMYSPWSRERFRWELKLLAGPPKPVRSRVTEEAKNNHRRRELRYKFPWCRKQRHQ